MIISHAFTLADQQRAEQSAILGTTRGLFKDAEFSLDEHGILWAVASHRQHLFAVCSLGPSWIFDPHASNRRSADLESRREELSRLSTVEIEDRLRDRIRQLRFGAACQAVYWLIHCRVLQAKRSVVRLPDYLVAEQIWGLDKSIRPKHWRQVIRQVLDSLSQLHVSATNTVAEFPFGSETALVTHASDLRRSQNDACDEDCPAKYDRSHHHFFVNIGRGFLGALERCVIPSERDDLRLFEFPARDSKNLERSLSQLGKTNQLTTVYLPAQLVTAEDKRLSQSQLLLFNSILRERTRKKREKKRDFAKDEILLGNEVPDHCRHKILTCPLLQSDGRYIQLNGNRKRKGCGYLINSEKGWLNRCGYPSDRVDAFLADIDVLHERLGLLIVGLRQRGEIVEWKSLNEMREMSLTTVGRRYLTKIHLRIYVDEEYVCRWNEYFGWSVSRDNGTSEPSHSVANVIRKIEEAGMTRKALAAGLSLDASLVSKILKGSRPCPDGFVINAMRWLDENRSSNQTADVFASSTTTPQDTDTNLQVALDYRNCGWSIIPQISGTKQVHVPWKPFQDRLPSEDQLRDWWTRWPDAGIALIAGSLSGVLVVDVDGSEAHQVLLERLGYEPNAPKSLSGSREPNRYHLFFRHPEIRTRAKKTPWHPKLEFRGHAGLAVLPPSLHASGHRYAWAESRSPWEAELPELPSKILAALRELKRVPPRTFKSLESTRPGSPSTNEFLTGKFADGPNWNNRLFNAACDLAGRGITLEKVELLLIEAAQPWNDSERDNAKRTIQSAFSATREPGRV